MKLQLKLLRVTKFEDNMTGRMGFPKTVLIIVAILLFRPFPTPPADRSSGNAGAATNWAFEISCGRAGMLLLVDRLIFLPIFYFTKHTVCDSTNGV